MLKRVRLNSQLLFVCWAKVKGINCSSQFHLHSFSLLRQKKNQKSSSRDLSQAKFLYFCAQNISFLPAAHTGLPHFGRAFLRYSITDVVKLIRRRKRRRKGPERERERVWENRTSSIVVIVVPFHHRARRRRRAYI